MRLIAGVREHPAGSSGPVRLVGHSNVSEKCPSQNAHLVMGQVFGIPPIDGGCFITVGSRYAADYGRIEHRGDVRSLISIGIGKAILRAAQDRQNRSEL